jgi:peptide/nickel transport system permease protein
MIRFIAGRLASLVPILAAVSVLIFALVRVTPTDPISTITSGKRISDETRVALEREFYLDRPLFEQYFIWIGGFVRGDFGKSFHSREPVAGLLAARLPTTLQLVFMSAIFAVFLAIPLGILSAVKKNGPVDKGISMFLLLCTSSPSFLTGLVFMLVFALTLGLFPAFGAGRGVFENFYYLFLPALALSLPMAALLGRMTRSRMIEELDAPYTQALVAKGARRPVIIRRHCLPNTLVPVITIGAIQLGGLVINAVLVENVFALGGVGALLVDGIKQSDYPMTQSIMLLYIGIYLILNLIVDCVYTVIDPRIKAEKLGTGAGKVPVAEAPGNGTLSHDTLGNRALPAGDAS